jgi:poly(ADP-ribose) glycohydrolase ARH3
MPLEGRWDLLSRGAAVREMLDSRLGKGTYTDDTQLMIALAEALLARPMGGEIDLNEVASRFGASYEPERGYGGNVARILIALRRGEPWHDAVEARRLPGGSWANGAAMRVAPVALAFYPDRGAAAHMAVAQAEVTGHSHPIGKFGARFQAVAVHLALEAGSAKVPLGTESFLRDAGSEAPGEYARAFAWIRDNLEADPREAARRLGTTGRASRSVPAAVWAFLSQVEDVEGAVVRAVNLGGDTDTIGAMAGALAGAYHGASAFPSRWVEVLENGPKGRDHVLGLADRLFERLSEAAD